MTRIVRRGRGPELPLSSEALPAPIIQPVETAANLGYQPRRPISAALIEEGILTRHEVEDALAAESRTGEGLVELVLRTRPTDEEKVARLLAREWGLPFMTAGDLRIDPRAVEQLPLSLARNLEAVPIGFQAGMLVVAVVSPRQTLFSRIVSELGQTSFVVVSRSALESLLTHLSALPTAPGMPSAAARGPATAAHPAPAQAGPGKTATAMDTVGAAGDNPSSVPAGTTDATSGELRNARDDLAQLRAVESELRNAREELTRLRGLERDLQDARDELARLGAELAKRAGDTEVPKRKHKGDAEKILRLESKLSKRHSSKTRSKTKTKP